MHDVIPCIFKYVTFYFIPKEINQNRSTIQCTEGCNIETYNAHSPSRIVQKSVVTAPGIIIEKEEVKQTGSPNSSAFGNPVATHIDVKREATDQGMLTFLSLQNIFPTLFAIREKK